MFNVSTHQIFYFEIILCDHIVTYQMQYIILLLFADYPHFHLWIAMSLDCRS